MSLVARLVAAATPALRVFMPYLATHEKLVREAFFLLHHLLRSVVKLPGLLRNRGSLFSASYRLPSCRPPLYNDLLFPQLLRDLEISPGGHLK